MRKTITNIKLNYFNFSLLFANFIAIILITYGWIITPMVSILSVAAAYGIVLIYTLFTIIFLPKIYYLDPGIIKFSYYTGLLAGSIFISEVLLEYIILPKDNTMLGLLEFGGVFIIYIISSVIFTYRNNKFKHTLLTALTSAVVSSLIWLITILFVFYLFHGTHRQDLVFSAEGDYQDFIRSGMADFSTFIMEDFFGAAFFHLLLVPAISIFLGVLGWGIGKLSIKAHAKFIKS